jgi:hypothetical protein
MSPLREIAYRLDPVLWVREVLGETPTPWRPHAQLVSYGSDRTREASVQARRRRALGTPASSNIMRRTQFGCHRTQQLPTWCTIKY